MRYTSEAARALDYYDAAYPNLIDTKLRDQPKDLIEKAKLATRIQIVQAFLGLDMVIPGTPSHLEAVKLLGLAHMDIPNTSELELPDKSMQVNLERDTEFIIKDTRFVMQIENNIPSLLKPEKLMAHLKQLIKLIWPNYLQRVRSKNYGQARLDLVLRTTQYELAYSVHDRFRYLRNSIIFNKTVEPFVGAPVPAPNDYLNLGLSKASVSQISSVAGRLATDTFKSLKTNNKKPDLPKDLNDHPGRVYYAPGDDDLLNWPSSTIRADKDEDGPGIHRADET